MTKRLVGGATLAMLLAFGMHQSVGSQNLGTLS